MEFKLPDLGEGLVEGEIVKWHVKVGDIIKKDQTIVEIETDKAVVDIPSPESGKIIKIKFKEGDTVKVGDTIVVIGKETDKIQITKQSVSVIGKLEEAEEITPLLTSKKFSKGSSKKILTTPKVRDLAKKLMINLQDVMGTGKNNMITIRDVQKAASKTGYAVSSQKVTKQVRKYDMYGYIERIPLQGIRKATAKKMIESISNIPHVCHMDEVEVSNLVKHREKEKKILEKEGINLTYLPFIVKAVALALKEYPSLNSTLENEDIVIKKYYNIGIAVDSNGSGLLVPVIKGADQKSIKTIAKEIIILSEEARSRKIDLAELKGGTFTITNIGSLGGRFATPIINYPESAILALGRIYERVVPNKSGFSIKPFLPISLSFDHRILDGAEAARFINKLFEYLKNPETISDPRL